MKVLSILPQMIKAVEDELVWVKRYRIGRSVLVYNGKLKGKSRDKFIYVFENAEEKKLLEDAFIKATVKGDEAEGVILSVDGQFVTVMLSKNFGATIDEAELEEDVTALYRKIIDRLKYVHDNPNAFYLSQSDELFYPKGKQSRANLDITFHEYRPAPNDTQKKAIKTALSYKSSFVWGPPGTGKTRTLGIIVGELFDNKKRTLIVSHANRAVDHALFNVIKVLREKKIPEEEQKRYVTRYSTTLLSQVEDINLKEYSFDEQLTAILTKITQEKQRLGELLSNYLKAEELIQQAEQARGELERYKSQKGTLSQRQEEIKRRLTLIENSINEYLVAALPKKLLLRVSGQHPGNLEKLKTRVEGEEQAIADELVKIDEEIGNLIQEIQIPKEKVKEYEKLKNEVDSLGGVELLKRMMEEQEQLDFSKYLGDKRVIATTLAKLATDETFKKLRFDTVIIDEASMAPMPLLLIAASLAQERVIITGDPQQLPPISLADTQEAQRWLERDIFVQASSAKSIQDLYDWENNSDFVCFLNTQYRMPLELSQLVSRHFYKNRIKNGDNISNEKAIEIVDTSKYNPFCGRDQRGKSRYNEVHSGLVVDLAQGLLRDYPPESVGIISPYRAQASHIRKSLQQKGVSSIEVGTIHTFQGREKEVIIFDTTDSKPMPAGRLLDEMGPNGEDALKILTVAFSRARLKLLVVVNLNYLGSHFRGRKLLEIVNEFYT